MIERLVIGDVEGARPAVPAIDRLEVWPHRPSEQRDPRRALGVFPVRVPTTFVLKYTLSPA